MTIEVAGRTYRTSNAYSVLLSYVAEFGTSYIADKKAEALAAVRLVWCAIAGDKPPFMEFLAAAAEDPSFAATAIRVRQYIYMPSLREQKAEGAAEPEHPSDELDVAQMLLQAGIPAAMFDRLPVYQLIDMAARKLDEGTGGGMQDYTVATPETIRELRRKIRGR